MQDLIARHGSFPSTWDRDADACICEGTKPFIQVQDQPLTFQFGTGTDLSAPPAMLWCAVDANPDHRLNYAKAVYALVKLFGDGEAHSGKDCTYRLWQFGRAQLTCTVYPPDKNAWRDTPHERSERDRVKASICIIPHWQPPRDTAP